MIPLYDETAPIACTIDSAEIAPRLALLERMRDALTGIDQTPTGLRLRFPLDDEVRRDLQTFAVDEKRCCEFWGFDIVDLPDALVFRWDAPPAAADLIANIERFFTTDEPASFLSGLL